MSQPSDINAVAGSVGPGDREPGMPRPAALPENMAGLANILDLAGAAIIAIDEAHRIRLFNKTAEAIFDYRAGEILGQPLDLLIPERFVASHRQHVQQFTSEQTSARQMVHQRPVSGRRRDGSEFAAEADISKIRQDGLVTFIVVVRDVSQRQRMEAELRQREQQYRSILEERVASRTRELTTILEISRNVALTTDLEPLLELALDQLKTVIDYAGASILILEGDEYRVRTYRGPASHQAWRSVRLPADGYYSQHMRTTGQPLIIDDVQADTPEARLAAARSYYQTTLGYVRSYLGAPLLVQERLIGVLNLHHSEPGYFKAHHAQLVMTFANHIAVAIQNARLFDNAQRRAEQFQVIGEVSRHITSILAVDELLVQTARLIREHFGYYHVHIGFIEGDEVVYKTGAAWDDPQFQLCESTRLKVGKEGFVGWVAATGEPLLAPDVSADPRSVAIEGDATRSELVLPLKAKGEVIGVLDIESEDLDAFDELDVAVLQSLASQVTVAIENARLFDAEHRRTEQFRAIGEISHRISSLTNVDHLLQEVTHLIRNSFGYDECHVGIALIEGDRLTYQATSGPLWDDPDADIPLRPLKVGQEGLSGWVAATGEPFLARDVSQEPRYVHLRGSQTRSELVLPIKMQGTTVGVLDVQSQRLNAFDETDLIVLQSLVDQVSVAMQNARLFAAERRRSQQLGAINEVGRHVTSILDEDELLAQTVRLIQETFGYYHAHIGLVENDVVVFRPAAGVWRHEAECHLCGRLRFRVGHDGASGRVAASGEPLLVPDVTQDARYVPMEAGQKGSALVLPLKARGQTIGVLNVESDARDAFDESDAAVLQSLASQVAVALENARLYRGASKVAALQERQRLARELHDSVSQALYGIGLGARTALTLVEQWGDQPLPPGALRPSLEYTMSLAQAGLAEMRALIFELRPESLENEGLVAALSKQAAAVEARHQIQVETSFTEEPPLSLEVKETFYRLAQEALHNVVKHAHASRVRIGLSVVEGQVVLEVHDNGIGFNPHDSFPGHLGLQSMRERTERLSGVLEIESTAGQGTRVRAAIPVAAVASFR